LISVSQIHLRWALFQKYIFACTISVSQKNRSVNDFYLFAFITSIEIFAFITPIEIVRFVTQVNFKFGKVCLDQILFFPYKHTHLRQNRVFPNTIQYIKKIIVRGTCINYCLKDCRHHCGIPDWTTISFREGIPIVFHSWSFQSFPIEYFTSFAYSQRLYIQRVIFRERWFYQFF
jgi:hypothetical protein